MEETIVQQLVINTKQYAEAYLRGYRGMVEALVSPTNINMSEAANFLPLVSAELGKTVSVSVLCEPFGTWVVFSSSPQARHVIVDAKTFSEEWNLFTGHDEKRRQIVALLGLPWDAVIRVVHIPSPGFLCSGVDSFIPRNAESHGRGDAWKHVPWLRSSIRNRELTEEWQIVTNAIRDAMNSAGTPESGRRFELLLRQALQMAGCAPREIRVEGQQIDASCWISGSPVLIEMLNSSDRADAKEVRDLVGKLLTRPASVIGILCAPAGFTGGAKAEVRRLANSRAILLWDRIEIEEFLAVRDLVQPFFLQRYRDFIDSAGGKP